MKLAIGSVQFGMNYGIANRQGQVNIDEARAILSHAFDQGLDTLDTAMAYGDSERRLGEIGVKSWRVVSKLPAVPDGCGNVLQWVEDSVGESLRRLKVKNIYGLLLHRPLQLLEKDGDKLYSSLQHLKRGGFVQKIGVSIYETAELDALWSRFGLEIVQAPFNVLDRRLIATGWLSRLAEQGTELHVRSIFLQGLLLMTPNERPKKFDRWTPLWTQWQGWLEQTGLTPLQACLRYALSFSEINKVIIGVDSLGQLNQILRNCEGPRPPVPDEVQSHDQDLLNPARWAPAK